MLAVTDAYAAGFFDGEGWVGVIPRKGSPYLKLSIAQNTREVLDALAIEYGGKVNLLKTRGIYQWTLYSLMAEAFLDRITPFTIVKTEQIHEARK